MVVLRDKPLLRLEIRLQLLRVCLRVQFSYNSVMIHFPQKNFWPYDELTFLREDSSSSSFQLQSPWLTLKFEVDDADIERAVSLSEKIASQSLAPEDISDVNWLFQKYWTAMMQNLFFRFADAFIC